jgi:hypothetical protein
MIQTITSGRHDRRHNGDHPSCQKLMDIAQTIFGGSECHHHHHQDALPNHTNTTMEADAGFFILLRDYLMTTTIRTVPATTPVSSLGKKKKRKKKKNKASGESGGNPNDEETTPPSPTDSANADKIANPPMDHNDDDDALNHHHQQQQQQQGEVVESIGVCLPRERLSTLWNDYLLNNHSTTDQVALQRAHHLLETVLTHFSETTALPLDAIDTIAIPYIKQEMIERRLDRIISTFLSKQQFVPSARSGTAGPELTDFLTHIVGTKAAAAAAAASTTTADTTSTTTIFNNNSNNNDDPFFVPLHIVETAVSDIVCTSCRRDAQAVLKRMSTQRHLELHGATFETVLDDYNSREYEPELWKKGTFLRGTFHVGGLWRWNTNSMEEDGS